MQILSRPLPAISVRSVSGLLLLAALAVSVWTPGQSAPAIGQGVPLAIGLLTLFVAGTVAIFAHRYMRADAGRGRFFAAFGAVIAAVLLLLVTRNLLLFAAAWCASGWFLAGLIGHSDGWAEARTAARRARSVFLVGDLALVGALGMLAWHFQSVQLDVILSGAAGLPPLLANGAALLLVAAAAVRCALPPFSGWLLSSMTAPTPVSALMHAGFVNAGGFLLIRFAPILEAAPAARAVAVAVGLCGAIYGIGIMMVRPDVKRSLAGSTVSQMGFMIMSCGLGAYAAALWHIIAHGLFKAWLFLGSGSAIGMKSPSSAVILSGRAALMIAAGTVGIALSIFSSGSGDPGLVPLLLGLATAAATLAASLSGQVPTRVRVVLLIALAALIAFHSAGLALAGLAVGANGAAIVPDWVLLGLLVFFLGAWAWQQHLVATARGLPLPVYVHLINAGSLPAVIQGEGK